MFYFFAKQVAQIICFALGGGASVNSLCSERLREQRSSGLFTANLTTACERIVHTSTLNTSTLAIGRELGAGRGWWWRSGDSGEAASVPFCSSAKCRHRICAAGVTFESRRYVSDG